MQTHAPSSMRAWLKSPGDFGSTKSVDSFLNDTKTHKWHTREEHRESEREAHDMPGKSRETVAHDIPRKSIERRRAGGGAEKMKRKKGER